jgi:hypothetical protein
MATLALWVGLCVAWTATAAQAQSGIALAILNPREGDVTSSTALLRVEADGGDTSTEVRFTVAIDGATIEVTDSDPAPAVDGSFGLPAGGGQIRIRLLNLSQGAHRLVVRPSSPAGVKAVAVAFAVAPKAPNRGFSAPTLIGALVLIGLFLLYRYKVLLPRLRRLEVEQQEAEPDPPSEPGGDGWGGVSP